MRAEIISVGTEILLGDIVNTNTQFLAKELASIGIEVYRQEVVGDNQDRLLGILEEALNRSDMVITTGGLGPTNDDLTKETACKFFNMDLELHQESLKALEEYLNNPEEVRSLTKLGSKYNIKRQTLSERFKKWGYEIINQQNKCRLNENCFDNMNTEE